MNQENIKKTNHTRRRLRNKISNIRAPLWTHEDDEKLKEFYNEETHEFDLKRAAMNFPMKSKQQITEHWCKCASPEIIRGNWTEEEDSKIKELVKKYGLNRWSLIAKEMYPRVSKQIRERWFNILDPAINTSKWTTEEDVQLINLHKRYGSQWQLLSTYFKGRTANSIKNHWNSTLQRRHLYAESINSQNIKFPLPQIQPINNNIIKLYENDNNNQNGNTSQMTGIISTFVPYSSSNIVNMFHIGSFPITIPNQTPKNKESARKPMQVLNENSK